MSSVPGLLQVWRKMPAPRHGAKDFGGGNGRSRRNVGRQSDPMGVTGDGRLTRCRIINVDV